MPQLFYQKTEKVSRAFSFLLSLPCWLYEQKLRKLNSKDFMSDERETENEIKNYSIYQGDRIAFNEIELQMDVFGD